MKQRELEAFLFIYFFFNLEDHINFINTTQSSCLHCILLFCVACFILVVRFPF